MCIQDQFGIIFFLMTSTVFLVDSFVSISCCIFSIACITVVWSLRPRSAPIDFKDDPWVRWRQRYIAIWRGKTISWLLILEAMSAGEMWKCSATVLIISSGVISRFASGEIISFKTSFAKFKSIGVFETLEKATIFVNAPSSSRMFDLILFAIYSRISLSIS